MESPATYAAWLDVFDVLKRGEDDGEVLAALRGGTLAWQSGVAERFSQSFADVLNARLDAALDRFQKAFGRSGGSEASVVSALLSLRKEFAFLAQVADLPALPDELRAQYVQLVNDQAEKVQESLEDSAKRSDRTGKLLSVVRNHPIVIR